MKRSQSGTSRIRAAKGKDALKKDVRKSGERDKDRKEEKPDSVRKRGPRSRIDESQVHNGWDEGFVYYEE